MPEFEYSIDALNTRGAFFGVSALIYVEGDDDEVFWDKIFSQIPNFSYSIESLGGSKEIDKYIEKVERDGLNVIIARDSDYLKYCDKISKHENIVYTIGYSIENTLYNSKSIYELTKNWCKASSVKRDVCDDWLSTFSEKFKLLLAIDIVNSKFESGFKVLYDSCECFMVGRGSSVPCDNKISEKINDLIGSFDGEVVNEVLEKIGHDKNNIPLLIRGHFFASGVSKFIVNQAAQRRKKLNVSNDGLYAAAMTYFSGNFNESHPHYSYYMEAALRAKSALQSG